MIASLVHSSRGSRVGVYARVVSPWPGSDARPGLEFLDPLYDRAAHGPDGDFILAMMSA